MEIEKGLVNKNLEIYRELEVDVDFGLSAFIINSKYIELRNEYGEVVLSRDSESPNNITVNELTELTDDVILIEDTKFEQGVVVLKYGAIITFSKSSFGYLKQRYAGQQFKIYVFIDGGLELIYEVEDVD